MPDARRAYPSDLSDAEWTILAPLLPPPAARGRPRRWPERLVADAVFYVLRSGCVWRMLPREFPPWPTVYARFRRWRVSGTLRRAHDALRARVRVAEGRAPEASASVIDSQSAETTGVGGAARGYDGAKRLRAQAPRARGHHGPRAPRVRPRGGPARPRRGPPAGRPGSA